MEVQYRSRIVKLLLIVSLVLSIVSLAGVFLNSIDIIEPEIEIQFHSASISLGNTSYSIKYVTNENDMLTIELWYAGFEKDILVDSCQMRGNGNIFWLSDIPNLTNGFDSWEFAIGEQENKGRVDIPLPETVEQVQANIECSM